MTSHRADIVVQKLPLGIYQANCYLVSCPESREAIVVDAPGTAGEILPHLQGLNARCIVLTHTHPDHTEALAELRQRLQIPVAAHREEALRVWPAAESSLQDGDVIEVGRQHLKVIHTPGHTRGSVCLLHGKYLVSGDTLFPGGPGKTSRPADFQQIVVSITGKLFPLPDDTVVCPGHGPDTVLGKEKMEFESFSSRRHPADLCGDVLWLSS
ncbi:MAG: MBL fold metallo-hydrolase [Chloroflexota bacterium]